MEKIESVPTIQLGDSFESPSFYSSEEENEAIYYKLRENPKPSIKLVDPELLQDRESETESSKMININPTRRRSKRKIRKSSSFFDQSYYVNSNVKKKKLKINSTNNKTTESWTTEPEPTTSSISDTTNDEDVAYCLMMLSRDRKWKKKKNINNKEVVDDDVEIDESEYDDEEEEEEELERLDYPFSKAIINRTSNKLGKYKCETCNRVFKSYQALGGHRASHKKMKLVNSVVVLHQTQLENNNITNQNAAADKVHECPVCFRVFSSGQALGGHKRTHGLGLISSETTTATHRLRSTSTSTKLNWIDLNLPADQSLVVDDDDYFSSQFEHSAISDAEFVRP
ncbi:hypothetical protein ACFE04_026441 [Oxalis oulophora]